jgi:hypothetical protein
LEFCQILLLAALELFPCLISTQRLAVSLDQKTNFLFFFRVNFNKRGWHENPSVFLPNIVGFKQLKLVHLFICWKKFISYFRAPWHQIPNPLAKLFLSSISWKINNCAKMIHIFSIKSFRPIISKYKLNSIFSIKHPKLQILVQLINTTKHIKYTNLNILKNMVSVGTRASINMEYLLFCT